MKPFFLNTLLIAIVAATLFLFAATHDPYETGPARGTAEYVYR